MAAAGISISIVEQRAWLATGAASKMEICRKNSSDGRAMAIVSVSGGEV
jgi:hypothetical protein